MTCKVIVQKNTFSESLAIVGRAVGSPSHLPILSNIFLNKDEDQPRVCATDLTVGVMVWIDANLDGDLENYLRKLDVDDGPQNAGVLVHSAYELLHGSRIVLHHIFWLRNIEGMVQQAIASRPFVLKLRREIVQHHRRKVVQQPKYGYLLAAKVCTSQALGIGTTVH